MSEQVLGTEEPVGRCSACLRKTWTPDEIGRVCGMTQPDGTQCPGLFGPLPVRPAEGERRCSCKPGQRGNVQEWRATGLAPGPSDSFVPCPDYPACVSAPAEERGEGERWETSLSDEPTDEERRIEREWRSRRDNEWERAEKLLAELEEARRELERVEGALREWVRNDRWPGSAEVEALADRAALQAEAKP